MRYLLVQDFNIHKRTVMVMTKENDWKIVLIDDEAGIRKVTGLTLKDAGYEVYTASNGKEGLALCREANPQIVITDVRMPGMDGISVLENLKNEMPGAEVIVATAFGEMDLAIRALQLDASDFITKPINDDALEMALKRARQRYTSRKQLQDYTRLLEEGWNETTTELMEMFNFQKNLIESSMDGIIGCNSEETVVIFNQSMSQILGYDKPEVLNRFKFGSFFRAEDENCLKSALKENKYGGKNRLSMYETSLAGKNNSTIPVQLSASIIFNQKGEEDGLVCFVRDLREIRKLEREVEDQAKILQQDKMMSLGRLAASVVHEINNPLAGVLNYCRLMIRILKRGDLKEKNREKFENYLTLVESETARCSHIISNLLTFSRKSSSEFSKVDVAELLNRSLLLSQHKLELSNIDATCDIQDNIPEINGDFNQLQQCIINLVFNSIDAMPNGGKLKLDANTDRRKNEVVIAVTDTGTGIPEKNLPHIFEPFFTSKDEGYGVGLGLSTLYGIVRHHNGEVEVKSQVNEGTTFFLRFPIPN